MPAPKPAISKASNAYRDRSEQLTGSSLSKCPVCHRKGNQVSRLWLIRYGVLAPHLWGQLALLLGVADSREVLGLAEDYASLPKKYRDGFELHFRQLISRDLGDSVSVFLTLTFHELDGNDIWQVNIEPSDRPVYVTDGQGSVFYLRVGNATRSLPVNETVKYVQTRWGAVT